MGEERLSPQGQSQVDKEVVAILRNALVQQNITQKELSARTGLSQPLISRRLNPYAASMPVHQFLLLCGGLDLDPTVTLAEAEKKAAAADRQVRHPRGARTLRTIRGSDREQVDAVGRQLAHTLWNACEDWDFITFAIDHFMDREDVGFWDNNKKQLTYMVALAELAFALGEVHPERDAFPLPPIEPPGGVVP